MRPQRHQKVSQCLLALLAVKTMQLKQWKGETRRKSSAARIPARPEAPRQAAHDGALVGCSKQACGAQRVPSFPRGGLWVSLEPLRTGLGWVQVPASCGIAFQADR
jgi:hypothetical protein